MSDLSKFREEQLADPEFREYFEEMKVADDIARAIIGGRLAKDWTQKELALHSGVSQADISRYENCEKLPTVPTLKKIAQALGCTVEVRFVLFE